jgi:uncharacterized protein YndB with AHSA1/START domain
MGKNQKNKKQAKPAKKAVKKAAKPSSVKKTAAKAKPSKPASKIKSKAVKGKVVKAAKPVKSARTAGAKAVAKKNVVKSKKVTPNKSKVSKVKAKVQTKAAKPKAKVVKSAKPVVKSKVKAKVVKPVAKPLKKSAKPVKAIKVVKKAEKVKPAKPVKVEKKKELKAPTKPVKEVKKPIAAIELPKSKPEKIKKGKGGRKPKKKDGDDDEPEIGDDAFIEEIIKSVKPSKNGPKQPKIIKTFINPMTALTPVDSGKKGAIPKKEPKGKFELEYVVRTSAGILYEFLSSPSGLSEWFADDVNIRDGIFTFFWDGSEQKAKLLALKEEKFIRLSWVDKPDGYYFEFKIEKDELTGDISLIIVDFADEASDEQTSKRLWDSQVNKLLHVIGSF